METKRKLNLDLSTVKKMAKEIKEIMTRIMMTVTVSEGSVMLTVIPYKYRH